MHYIWHVIYCVWFHIQYMCDLTQWLYLWHHNLYVYDISTLYGITHSVMTTQPLHNLTATMSDITPTVSVSSHSVYPFYQTQCMNDITATVCMISYALHRTSHPLCMTTNHFLYDIKSSISDITSTISDLTSTESVSSHPLYRCYHSHYMYDITATVCVISHPVYVWHRIHYVGHHNTLCGWHHTQNMYDIICTADDIISTLSHQTTVFMMSHSLQAWHHIHSIRHCPHCIFVITTSPLISHPIVYDIMPSLCVPSYALHITSHLLLISSHYCTYDITTSTYKTTSSM